MGEFDMKETRLWGLLIVAFIIAVVWLAMVTGGGPGRFTELAW